MEALRNWLRSVVVIIVLASFLEYLLPGDELRRYVRMVVNLLLVLALVGPIVQIIRRPPTGLAWPAVVGPPQEQTAELVSAGQRLSAQAQSLFVKEGAGRLSKRIAEVAAMVQGVASADADVVLDSEGAVTRINITVACTGDFENVSDTIRKTVGALIEIPVELVTVNRVSGKGE